MKSDPGGERLVSRPGKTLDRILRGTADANLRFTDVCGLLRHLGFSERIRGDHHIFTRDGIREIINLQPRDGMAKPYQVKQIRELIVRQGLAGQPEAEAPEREQGEAGENDPSTQEDADGN
jgi:hypothetical protein